MSLEKASFEELMEELKRRTVTMTLAAIVPSTEPGGEFITSTKGTIITLIGLSRRLTNGLEHVALRCDMAAWDTMDDFPTHEGGG